MFNHLQSAPQSRKAFFPRTPAILDKIGGYLLPSPCLLCGGQLSSQDRINLCQHCTLALPRQGTNRCSCCSLPLTSASALCGECLKKPPAFTHSAIPFLYDYPLDHLILEFKYRHQFASGHCLGELLLKHIQEVLETGEITLPDFLIPVPLHWWRQWLRGFNQAEWLAKHLGKGLDISVLNSCQRKYQHQSQKGLGRRERQRNLRNMFTLIPKWQTAVRGKHIAVVDDVVTTGATARVLSDLLIRAGAKRVDIWALARTPPASV